jgi:hypothetical protein
MRYFAQMIGQDTMTLDPASAPESLEKYKSYQREVYQRVRKTMVELAQSLAHQGRAAAVEAIPIEQIHTAQECYSWLSTFVEIYEREKASALVDAIFNSDAASPGVAPPIENNPPSPTADRNETFLAWYEDQGSETHRSPARIRDRWNSEHPKLRVASRDVVKKAIAAARKRRERTGENGGNP